MRKTELYKLRQLIKDLSEEECLDDFTINDLKYAILNALDNATE